MEKKTLEIQYNAAVANVELNSPYKKIKGESKYMTAAEMGKLLGLKKTERYWLLHKHYFEWEELLGEYRVNIQSFERWYANQVKYKKITGEEPGRELKMWTFSPQKIASLLDVHETVVYELLIKNEIEIIIVDHLKRVPKKAFYQWYGKQRHYRTAEDRKKDDAIVKATISMPEIARLLGITRNAVYSIIKNPKYKEMFEIIIVADQKRIKKKSFEQFLESQDKYFLEKPEKYNDTKLEETTEVADYRRRNISNDKNIHKITQIESITCQEVANIANVSKSTITKWIAKGLFPSKKIGRSIIITRSEFETFLKEKTEEGVF